MAPAILRNERRTPSSRRHATSQRRAIYSSFTWTLAIFATVFPATVSTLSLTQFTPNLTSGLSTRCDTVYKSEIPACTGSDFPSIKTPSAECSQQCLIGLSQLSTLLANSCSRSVDIIPDDSLIAFFLRGEGLTVLCGVAAGAPLSGTIPSPSTSGSTTTPSNTTIVARPTTTTTTLESSDSSTPIKTTTSSKTTNTSTSTSSSLQSIQSKTTTTTSDVTKSAGEMGSSTATKSTSNPTSTGRSGGGSPFDGFAPAPAAEGGSSSVSLHTVSRSVTVYIALAMWLICLLVVM